MYAPKLRDMTADERWAEGFAYRIDTRADEIKAEIAQMVKKARVELGLMEAVTPTERYIDVGIYQSGNALDALYWAQAQGMRHISPTTQAACGMTNIGLIGSAWGGINPFGSQHWI
jgi:hypothetical protein